MAGDHRKQSLYFPEEMLEDIQREALRQDRSISWIVQQAWKLARAEIKKKPSLQDVLARPAQGQSQGPSQGQGGPTGTPPPTSQS